MSYDAKVDSNQLNSDLTSIANAIRTKGGTSSQLAFPSGFVSAVQAIPTGTTPTGTKQISITTNGTTTEDVTNYASAQITANVPNTYAAGDEGKVVSGGTLVSQTSGTCNSNGTVDTTLINSLAVNVSPEIEFVEYISTTGSSYFQTGVKANQTSILDGVFYATAAGMPYGCMSSGNSASVSAYFSSGETNNRFGNKAVSKLLSFNTLTNVHQEKGSFVVNDSSLDYASVSNFETPYSLRLGAASTATGGVNTLTFKGRIYHFRHIKGGSIAFDGRPAKKNGVYGIYDMVSKTFFQSETATPFSGHDYT